MAPSHANDVLKLIEWRKTPFDEIQFGLAWSTRGSTVSGVDIQYELVVFPGDDYDGGVSATQSAETSPSRRHRRPRRRRLAAMTTHNHNHHAAAGGKRRRDGTVVEAANDDDDAAGAAPVWAIEAARRRRRYLRQYVVALIFVESAVNVHVDPDDILLITDVVVWTGDDLNAAVATQSRRWFNDDADGNRACGGGGDDDDDAGGGTVAYDTSPATYRTASALDFAPLVVARAHTREDALSPEFNALQRIEAAWCDNSFGADQVYDVDDDSDDSDDDGDDDAYDDESESSDRDDLIALTPSEARAVRVTLSKSNIAAATVTVTPPETAAYWERDLRGCMSVDPEDLPLGRIVREHVNPRGAARADLRYAVPRGRAGSLFVNTTSLSRQEECWFCGATREVTTQLVDKNADTAPCWIGSHCLKALRAYLRYMDFSDNVWWARACAAGADDDDSGGGGDVSAVNTLACRLADQYVVALDVATKAFTSH